MLTWFRKKMKVIMIVVAVLFVASMFYGLGYSGLKGDFGGGKKASNVLATVNGKEVDPVRFKEILNRIYQGYGKQIGVQDLAFVENLALGQTLDYTMLLNEAKKKVKVSGREVDAAVDSIMQQQKVPSKRELEKALKQMGMTVNKFRDLIKDDILVQKLNTKLREEVRVTPDDLKEVKVSHILVSGETEAKNLLDRIKKGEDFAALAKKYSKDPGSAAKGGDLGYFTSGMMVEPFERTAFSLKPGEVGITQTNFGYHVIKVVDSRLRTFKGEEKDIEKAALKDKQEKTFQRWYAEVRGKAKIDVVNPVLKGHMYRFRGMLKEAVEEYKNGALADPANPTVHVYLGDTYTALNQKALALTEYENAVKIEGGNPELYIILGKAYESMGEKDLAVSQYRKASLIAGDNKALHEMLLKLFQTMKKGGEVSREKEEIKRIEKKEAFEKEFSGKK